MLASHYPVVEMVRSVNANAVIPVLDKMFSIFGIPIVLKTDKGSPFNGEQLSKFAVHFDFRHWKIENLSGNKQTRLQNTLCAHSAGHTTQSVSWKQET